VSGAIDCTSHFRNRVHPRQGDYYCGDKRGHFISDQVSFFSFCFILHVHVKIWEL
jgi:hypothetical protein